MLIAVDWIALVINNVADVQVLKLVILEEVIGEDIESKELGE